MLARRHQRFLEGLPWLGAHDRPEQRGGSWGGSRPTLARVHGGGRWGHAPPGRNAPAPWVSARACYTASQWVRVTRNRLVTNRLALRITPAAKTQAAQGVVSGRLATTTSGVAFATKVAR